MTKLPKIEKCVCGRVGFLMPGGTFVRCRRAACWAGPFILTTKTDAILAWNAVMRAAKAGKKARITK